MNIAFWFGFWTQTRPCLSHYSLFWTPKDFGHFWIVIFLAFFQPKILEFDRAARSRPQSCFFLFLQRPRNNNDSLICARNCVFFKKKSAVVLKRKSFNFIFCENSNKRIHFFLLRRNMIFVQK